MGYERLFFVATSELASILDDSLVDRACYMAVKAAVGAQVTGAQLGLPIDDCQCGTKIVMIRILKGPFLYTVGFLPTASCC
jgi:hypothetical protein